MGQTFEYPKNARNTVNRLGKKRGIYELGKIHHIIQSSPVLHVSFSPAASDPFPAILPMIGVMASYDHPSSTLEEPLDCYLHGYVSSRIMNLSRSDQKGVPVCIAATKVDGLVLSLTPNSHSYNYRSAVLFGYAVPVTDVEEKIWAMEKVTEKVVEGRWAGTRVPPNAAEMQSTQMLKVVIESGSGKIRDGPPGDEKGDLADDEVVDRVWTGVVPLKEVLCEPVPSSYNRVKEVPEHVSRYITEFNEERENYIEEVNGRVRGEVKMYGEI